MPRFRVRLGLAWSIATLIVARSGLADSGEPTGASLTDAAIAEAAFNEARTALLAGDAARACPLLEASQRSDPALGTRLLLAHCYEALGKTATAWSLFLEVQATAHLRGDAERERIARIRAEALSPRLVYARFQLPPASARPSGLTVDGTAVDPAVWDVSFPLDPGTHRIVASAPGRVPLGVTIDVPETGSVTISIPELERVIVTRAARTDAPASKGLTRKGGRAKSRGITDSRSRQGRTSQAWPWVVAGTGALALGAGGTFALLAQRDYDASASHCRTSDKCSPTGIQLRDRAFARAGWATAATLGGVALEAVAAYLWFGSEVDAEHVALNFDRAHFCVSAGGVF
ncbi:MAG TPA: hypothetical protein VHM70_30295 [Polyangiaceae bacterium]|nr:hypothetical protein [Polyangiaceae bacterium]